MSLTVFEVVWREIQSRHWVKASAVDGKRFPELSRRALDEATQFGHLPVPDSGHELNLRRIAAHHMTTSWENALLKVTLHVLVFAALFASGPVFGQQQGLADQIMDANEIEFSAVFPNLKEQQEQEIPKLIREIERKLPADAEDEDKEKLAKRQANAAVALLKLNQDEKVWPLLQHSPDPRVRSYLVHKMGPLGVDPQMIIDRLGVEQDVTTHRALLLSLGEYPSSGLSQENRHALLPKLREMYQTDGDSGLHAAAAWLLRRWQQHGWLKKVNEEWAHDKERREKRMDSIEKSLKNDSPQWYVNGHEQTMVVISGPVEFMMGLPVTERGKKGDTAQQKKRISRKFAIDTKPVTLEQFRKFDKDFSLPEAFSRASDVPAINTSWYQAVEYCNWLSKEEGIPEKEWCFEIKGKKTKLKENYLSLTGYRLPTEAEMEYATRSGAATARYFGESDELLPMYAWYDKNSRGGTQSIGSLKPNDFGLFDAQGNVYTWCQESYRVSSKTKTDGITEDQEDDLVIADRDFRVLRGGCFSNQSSLINSAHRNFNQPSLHFDAFGFRLARTMPHAAPAQIDGEVAKSDK